MQSAVRFLRTWSAKDLAGLPEIARRYELLEGTLLVNPPPSPPHQLVSWTLTGLLRAAATRTLQAVEAVGVRVSEDTVFIRDILVAGRDVVLARGTGQ